MSSKCRRKHLPCRSSTDLPAVGRIARTAFRGIPESLQIEAAGHWSFCPQFLAQQFWATEFCLCRPHERCRAVVRQRRDWLESLVLIVEWRTGHGHTPLLYGREGPLCLEESRGDATSTFAVMCEGHPLGLGLTISILLKTTQPLALGLSVHRPAIRIRSSTHTGSFSD